MCTVTSNNFITNFQQNVKCADEKNGENRSIFGEDMKFMNKLLAYFWGPPCIDVG